MARPHQPLHPRTNAAPAVYHDDAASLASYSAAMEISAPQNPVRERGRHITISDEEEEK